LSVLLITVGFGVPFFKDLPAADGKAEVASLTHRASLGKLVTTAFTLAVRFAAIFWRSLLSSSRHATASAIVANSAARKPKVGQKNPSRFVLY